MSHDEKTVGELLKEARVGRGLSIESIAKEICVRSSYLSAIEADDHKALPEKTFAVGFVRAYAMALKQDAKAIVEQFKLEFGEACAAPVLAVEMPLAAPRRGMPGWLSPIAGVLGVSLCWAMFGTSIVPLGVATNSPIIDAQTDVAQLNAVKATLPAIEAPVSEGVVKAEVASAGASAVDAPKPAYRDAGSLFTPAAIADDEQKPSGPAKVTLRANEDAWVRLANADGTEIWSGVLREGQSYRPRFDGTAILSTSNAGGVMLSYGLGEASVLGARGEVVTGLELEEAQVVTASQSATRGAQGSR